MNRIMNVMTQKIKTNPDLTLAVRSTKQDFRDRKLVVIFLLYISFIKV